MLLVQLAANTGQTWPEKLTLAPGVVTLRSTVLRSTLPIASLARTTKKYVLPPDSPVTPKEVAPGPVV